MSGIRLTGARERGVTLIELLVAVAILGVIAALLYGTFSRTLAGRDRASTALERYARRALRSTGSSVISKERSRAACTRHPRRNSSASPGPTHRPTSIRRCSISRRRPRCRCLR
jgi:prepilin-type N-terminal cleavage/methylation domain-containing protein